MRVTFSPEGGKEKGGKKERRKGGRKGRKMEGRATKMDFPRVSQCFGFLIIKRNFHTIVLSLSLLEIVVTIETWIKELEDGSNVIHAFYPGSVNLCSFSS